MLNVTKVARLAEVPADTVRYYDRRGLLGDTQRTPSGYRIYSDEVIDRLGFIRKAKRCGLRLREITELLEIRDNGLCPCGRTVALLEQRIEEANLEMQRLAGLKEELKSMIKSVTNKNEWCYRADDPGTERSGQNGKKAN